VITVETTPPQPGTIRLGEFIQFRVSKPGPEVETRYLLVHERIIYTKPVLDWTADPLFLFFPEAPGDYRMVVEWRAPDGSRGQVAVPFAVTAGTVVSWAPQKVRVDRSTSLWAPSGWESMQVESWEQQLVALVKEVLTPGSVVYDVGANMGLYSVLFARLTGAEGHVYCFEANPVCVHFLRANLSHNAVANADIIPLAIAQEAGWLRFNINYGNSNLGLSEVSHFYAAKTGHEIQVECRDLDGVVSQLGLPPPGLIKIDIEGAEERAIRGMHSTLAAHLPILVLELHGAEVARLTLDLLTPMGYRYRHPSQPEQVLEQGELLDRHATGVFQTVAQVPRG